MKASRDNQFGFSLIELMTALGIGSLIILVSGTMISNLYQEKRRADFILALNEIRVSFQRAVLDSNAWAQSETSDSQMSCFSGSAATSCLSLNGMPSKDLKIYSGGQLLFDSISATSGYTQTGQPCGTYGGAGCILKPHLKWQAQCNLTADPNCNAPLILVSLTYQLSGTDFSSVNFASYGFQLSKATFAIQSANTCAGVIPIGCTASQTAVCVSGTWACEEFGL